MSNSSHRTPEDRPELNNPTSENKHHHRVLTIKRTKNASIRQAAELLFIKKDYEDITMDEIAAAAHVSKATLYKHFRTKEVLYLATIKDLFAQFDQDQSDLSLDLQSYLEKHVKDCLLPRNIDLVRHCASQILRFPSLSQFIWDMDRPAYKALSHYIKQLPTHDAEHSDAHLLAHQLLSNTYVQLIYPVWYGYHPSPSASMIREHVEKALLLLHQKEAETPLPEEDLSNATSTRAVYF
ncbi:MAG: TetR/AcrR family transcriptional regulator [Candidatus Nucleicultricaceae bacterium]